MEQRRLLTAYWPDEVPRLQTSSALAFDLGGSGGDQEGTTGEGGVRATGNAAYSATCNFSNDACQHLVWFEDGGWMMTEGCYPVTPDTLSPVDGTGLSGGGGLQPPDLSWSPGPAANDGGPFGRGWHDTTQPYLVDTSPAGTFEAAVLVAGGGEALHFQADPGRSTAGLQGRHQYSDLSLIAGGGDTIELQTRGGGVLVFKSFDAAVPAAQRGRFVEQRDGAGNVVRVEATNIQGHPTQVSHHTADGVERGRQVWTYDADGRLASVTQSNHLGVDDKGTADESDDEEILQPVRTWEMSYYGIGDVHGGAGDLKLIRTLDETSQEVGSRYFRYGTAGHDKDRLTVMLGQDGHARAVADFAGRPGGIEGATDLELRKYAEATFAYDASGRISRAGRSAGGCSSCADGVGVYTYAYESNTAWGGTGYNAWATKMTETLPDGNAWVVYANEFDQPILKVFRQDDGQGGVTEWATYWRYGVDGRVIYKAMPSAVAGYDETKNDLLHEVNGNLILLRDDEGLIYGTSYYGNTTASQSVAGGVEGYVQGTYIAQGEFGIPVEQTRLTYHQRSAGGTVSTRLAGTSRFEDEAGQEELVTTYNYVYHANSHQPSWTGMTLPVVGVDENGSGVAESRQQFYRIDGLVSSQVDEAGVVTSYAYHAGNRAVAQIVRDDGGLNLTDTYEVDALGRILKHEDPNGNVTYMTYIDAAQERRVYGGWDDQQQRPTVPTFVLRFDRANGYLEQLTMSAPPQLDAAGRPAGTEAVASITSYLRQYQNEAGQVTHVDRYHDLGGLAYATGDLGDAGTHYDRTTHGYDLRGRLEYSVDANGTADWTTYDGLGRVTTSWVGTDIVPTGNYGGSPTIDTGDTRIFIAANGFAPPGTDLLPVATYVYDGGLDGGDSLLTRSTRHVDALAANDRTSVYDHDWRNRRVLTRAGVTTDGTGTTAVEHRYVALDNLGRTTRSGRYGAGVVTGDWPSTGGVPDAPLSSSRSHRSETHFDARGRVWKHSTFSVDPADGVVGPHGLDTRTWYDPRGLVAKTHAPGGLVTKHAHDAAGRRTLTSLTDGRGDAGYADAFDTAGDVVLEERHTRYDANGNAVAATTRLRYPDLPDSVTGPFGPTSAADVVSRASHTATYYDAADRPTHAADYGTNGGLAWTRPAAPPAASSDGVLVGRTVYGMDGRVFATVDPRGNEDRYAHDLRGRRTTLIESSAADGRTTRWTYNGNGDILTMTAVMPGGWGGVGNDQTTRYLYNARTTGTNPGGLNSNGVLTGVAYPSVGAGTETAEAFAVNRLGQRTAWHDRNGTTHTYAYDTLGRNTGDAATTLGTGVDGLVRELATTYDDAGRVAAVSSLDAAGTVLDQVARVYNGLGQLTRERQEHGGIVNAHSPAVGYTYSEMPYGANHSRPTSVTYPDGWRLDHRYGPAGGTGDRVSRLRELGQTELPAGPPPQDPSLPLPPPGGDGGLGADAGPSSGGWAVGPGVDRTFERYAYLGLSQVSVRDRVDAGHALESGLVRDASDGTVTGYGLDRFGRAAEHRWTTPNGQGGPAVLDGFAYGHDANGNRLYRENLVDPAMGELYHEGTGYDALDRLTAFSRGTLNAAKDGLAGTASRRQSWDLDPLGNWSAVTTDGVTQKRTHDAQNRITQVSAAGSPTHSANGEMTRDETGRTLVYDAWGRLAGIDPDPAVSGDEIIYRYDALGRRITDGGEHLYYGDKWQVLETRDAAGGTGVGGERFVWSPVYVDALVLRDRDTTGDGVLGGGDERLYVLQDANYNVTAVVGTGATVMERYAYDPYGERTVLDADFAADAGGGDGLSDFAFVHGHQGGRHDPAAGLVHFRHRDLDTSLGRWTRQDPAGYVDGGNLYLYLSSLPTGLVDPEGLCPATANGCGAAGGMQFPGTDVSGLGANFKVACDLHDMCYGTCGASRTDCDDPFCVRLEQACYVAYSRLPWFAREPWRLGACLTNAQAYCTAVRSFGGPAYESAQADACGPCPSCGANPANPL